MFSLSLHITAAIFFHGGKLGGYSGNFCSQCKEKQIGACVLAVRALQHLQCPLRLHIASDMARYNSRTLLLVLFRIFPNIAKLSLRFLPHSTKWPTNAISFSMSMGTFKLSLLGAVLVYRCRRILKAEEYDPIRPH